ncbi:MAG: mechanosensitive ion channel family protein [Syntrophobacteraceae bacterium]|jgi:small-conductance mechanosensitive channel|nr:mechanosensitive ion channel family protein [Syntrophobacteraceae bacterium]
MTSIRSIRAVCTVLLAGLLFSIPAAGWAQMPVKMKPKAPPKAEGVPPDLSHDQVDGYLAGLTDEQARKLLAAELKKSTAARSEKAAAHQVGREARGIPAAFYGAQAALSGLSERIGGIVAGAYTSAETDVWERMVGGKGLDAVLAALAFTVLIILAGLAAERLLLWKSESLRTQLLQTVPAGGWERVVIFLSRLILNSLGIGVYALVTFLGHFLLYGQSQSGYLVSSLIILSYYFRVIELLARLVASPGAPDLRLVSMSDSDARFLYRWIVVMAASVLPGSALAVALQKSGASRELFLFAYSTAGPIVSLLLVVMIWRVRHRVAGVIRPPGEPGSASLWLLRQRCADLWHYPAIVVAVAVGVHWWARVLIQADATIIRLILSLFLVPLCIAMDQWMHQLLGRLRSQPREVIDFTARDEGGGAALAKAPGSPGEPREKAARKDVSLYFPLIRKGFRIVLLIFLFFGVLDLWGIDLDIGWIFARSVLGVVIALVLGLVAWEIAKARIDQRLAEEMSFQGDEAEEGGSGGSRSGTLLMLLRKFILVFLFIVVGFSILGALGVNIAPLLAGAGVVGLAIGFGSQTLVKDIISGVFFLIDDAFRVGDYVEAGTAKGTVEQISLRSLRLRHPRGQIFVVPFGDLKVVQNFTRDYIIEKLDVRVQFDTDPDVIRKIVKKINKEIRAEEEFAGVLLSDIKSAGVRGMDDSAMIMRVKFKCIPGEQFILRREVFHRLQKAFKQKGIEFADRKVTVYLPPQSAPAGGSGSSEGQSLPPEAAGAAAAAAIMQAEAEALAKAAEGKKKGE